MRIGRQVKSFRTDAAQFNPNPIYKKARKKPIVIEYREPIPDVSGCELVHTHEGILVAKVGEDYVIKGVKGELYPIKKAIFEETYERLEP